MVIGYQLPVTNYQLQAPIGEFKIQRAKCKIKEVIPKGFHSFDF